MKLTKWLIRKCEDFKYRRWAVERGKIIQSIDNLNIGIGNIGIENTRYIMNLEKRILHLEEKLAEKL